MHNIDRSLYAFRLPYRERTLTKKNVVFENWSKLEANYPVSSLICKLQEIRGIGLTRQQQHPPFSLLVSYACVRTCILPPPLSLSLCVCVYIYVFRFLVQLGIFAVIRSTWTSFSLKNRIIYPIMHSVVIEAVFPICVSIYCFFILHPSLFFFYSLFLSFFLYYKCIVHMVYQV